MTSHRIWHLRKQHRLLEQRLEGEMSRAVPDALTIQLIKRRKLQVKDALHSAERGQPPHTS